MDSESSALDLTSNRIQYFEKHKRTGGRELGDLIALLMKRISFTIKLEQNGNAHCKDVG
jgi:hypothetical protein